MISESNLPVGRSSLALGVSPRGYYKWRHESGKHLPDNDSRIRQQIHEIALEFPRYGYRRMTHGLSRLGLNINHKRVLRLMKEENLLIRRKKYMPKTTQSKHGLPKYQNLLKHIVLNRINQACVADITYIRLLYEFVYLAVIMDLFSRRIIGWALSRNPDTQLTLEALNLAITERGMANLVGCIHHSDQGVQYAATAYVERLREAGMRPSMGEVGNSYENAFAESLIKTIKYEEVYMNEYETIIEAQENIRCFIEEVYNRKRLHSSIGYQPPIEFEEKQVLDTSIQT
jgi:transposase InsO family protein